jgi:uncharacterized protein (DUF4415 family)
MKQTSSIKTRAISKVKASKTKVAKAKAMTDDAPKLTQAQLNRARFKVTGLDASRAQWQAAVQAQVGKRRISIMLDAPIIDHFKAAAGERGYQTLINDVLRRAVEGERVVADVRAVIRQELRAASKRIND